MVGKSKKSTAQSSAYSLILDKIIRERLRPGTPLREEHLAEEFGLSPTPIREAFCQLEHDGWVTRTPYKGTRLRTFSMKDIDDLYLLREAIEGMAGFLVAERGTQSDLDRIRDVLEKEEKNERQIPEPDEPNPSLSYEPEFDFHAAIVAASHSELLVKQHSTLRAQLNLLYFCMQEQEQDDIDAVCAEHRCIFEALSRRWGETAESLLRRHIDSARRKILQTPEIYTAD